MYLLDRYPARDEALCKQQIKRQTHSEAHTTVEWAPVHVCLHVLLLVFGLSNQQRGEPGSGL